MNRWIRWFAVLVSALVLASPVLGVLPQQLKSARLTDATPARNIDNEIGNVEKALSDILGLPLDTDITAAPFSITAAGIVTIAQNSLAAAGATLTINDNLTVANNLVVSGAGPHSLAGPLIFGSSPRIDGLTSNLRVVNNAGTLELLRVADNGILALGTTVTAGAAAGDLVLANGGEALRFVNFAGTSTLAALSANASDQIVLGPSAHVVPAGTTDTVALLAATQTLTNKTLNLASNTLTGTLALFNAALSDADFASLAGIETLTNKTLALGSNTLSGTTAQFNTALTDNDFATLAGIETLTNKTLTGAVVSGAAPATPVANTLYTDSVVKAWVRFNGSGTVAINDDLNVSSITDNGVGDYTINWATSFASVDYAVVGMANEVTAGRATVVYTSDLEAGAAGSHRIETRDDAGIAVDPSMVRVLAIGDQ